MSSRDEIKTIVLYLKMAFPNFRPELDGKINSIDVLSDLLGDLPNETLWAAVKSCCAEPGRAFAPSAGEIRGKASELHAKASGIKSSGEAWQEIMDVIRDQGCHGTPRWSSELVKRAVDCIGLESIGMSEDVMPDRAHFLRIYTDLQRRALEDAAELPQVTEYVQGRRQITDAAIKQLTDREA